MKLNIFFNFFLAFLFDNLAMLVNAAPGGLDTREVVDLDTREAAGFNCNQCKQWLDACTKKCAVFNMTCVRVCVCIVNADHQECKREKCLFSKLC